MLALVAVAGFACVGVFGEVQDTESDRICGSSPWSVLSRDAGELPPGCDGEAGTQLALAGGLLLVVLWLLGRRMVVLVRVARTRRAVAPPGADGVEPAIGTAATRGAYRVRRRGTVVVGVAAAASIVVFGLLVSRSGTRLAELEDDGVRVRGTVTDLTREAPFLNTTVRFRFTLDGTRRVGSVLLTDESPRFRVGQHVDVLTARDASESTIVGEDDDPGWLVLVTIVAFLASIALPWLAYARLVSWWRVSLVLRRLPWAEATVRIARARTFRFDRYLVEVHDPRFGPQVLGVGVATEPNPYEVASRRVWVAGAPGVGYVVAPAGGHRLLWAGSSGIPGRTRLWSNAFGRRRGFWVEPE